MDEDRLVVHFDLCKCVEVGQVVQWKPQSCFVGISVMGSKFRVRCGKLARELNALRVCITGNIVYAMHTTTVRLRQRTREH